MVLKCYYTVFPEQVKDESWCSKAKCSNYKIATVCLQGFLKLHEVKNIGGIWWDPLIYRHKAGSPISLIKLFSLRIPFRPEMSKQYTFLSKVSLHLECLCGHKVVLLLFVQYSICVKWFQGATFQTLQKEFSLPQWPGSLKLTSFTQKSSSSLEQGSHLAEIHQPAESDRWTRFLLSNFSE